MQADWPLLSVLVWLPIAAGLVLLMIGDRSPGFGRWLGLAASVATFLASVVLWRDFDRGMAAMQFVERGALDRCIQRLVPPGRGRHIHAAHRAHGLHYAARVRRRLDGDREAGRCSTSRPSSSWKA